MLIFLLSHYWAYRPLTLFTVPIARIQRLMLHKYATNCQFLLGKSLHTHRAFVKKFFSLERETPWLVQSWTHCVRTPMWSRQHPMRGEREKKKQQHSYTPVKRLSKARTHYYYRFYHILLRLFRQWLLVNEFATFGIKIRIKRISISSDGTDGCFVLFKLSP